MKLKSVFFLSLFLIAGTTVFTQNTIKNITIHQADSLVKVRSNDSDFVILDIRTDMEFEKSHLENSVQINYLERKGKREIFDLDKEKSYLIYCRSGGRSGKLLKKMKLRRFKEVYNMLGGIRGWTREGYPVISKDPQFPGPDSRLPK